MSMRMEMNIRGLDGVLETLQSLPKEIVSKRGGPVKLALAKGARFMRDRAKENLRRAIAQGPTTASTQGTENSIISSRGKQPFGGRGERYLVRVKRRDFINAHGYRTNPRMTANLMEYGAPAGNQPARPWLRPVVREHGEEVINLVSADLKRRVDLAVKELARQNANK